MSEYKHLTDHDYDIINSAIAMMGLHMLNGDHEKAADQILGAVDRVAGLHDKA